MLLFRSVLLVLLVSLVVSLVVSLMETGPLAAAVLNISGDDDVKPPAPDYVYTRTPFDCTPRLVLNLSVGLADSLVDDTTGGVNLIDSYPCAPWQEMGPEHIYQLVVAAGDTVEFWAGLRNVDPLVDHDLFLLNGCDTDSCLIGVNTEFTAVLTGGSYYLIIDGAGSSQPDLGPYTLQYTTRFVGVDPQACQAGVATVIDINLPETIIDENLFEKPNFVQSFSCSPSRMKGGEAWYTLTLPAPVDNQFGGQDFSQFKVEFTVLAPTLDIALWLFDGCGTTPTCLDYVNDRIGGVPEILTFRNETDQEMTVWLAVDCWRAPVETGTGYFTVKFTSDIIVPTENTSFGSLRSLYR
jgi:hypothetical protein